MTRHLVHPFSVHALPSYVRSFLSLHEQGLSLVEAKAGLAILAIVFSNHVEARFSLSRKEFCYNPYDHGNPRLPKPEATQAEHSTRV